jgi:hypothetical protein
MTLRLAAVKSVAHICYVKFTTLLTGFTLSRTMWHRV